MAAGRIPRRLLSFFSSRQPHTSSSFHDESSKQLLPSANAFFREENCYRRGLQTLPGLASKQTPENVEEHQSSSTKANPAGTSSGISSEISNSNSEFTYSAKSALKISPRHDLAMMFTCNVCETRSVKTLSRESYEKGVVIARCGGCNNYHLIADHLGMFGEPGSIEDILAARGEEVRRGSSDTLNLTLEDLVGKKIMKT